MAVPTPAPSVASTEDVNLESESRRPTGASPRPAKLAGRTAISTQVVTPAALNPRPPTTVRRVRPANHTERRVGSSMVR